MENNELQQLISQAKQICIIPSEHEPESLTAALALFYTLKDLGKNVNVLIDKLPKNLQFLVPSLDFIQQPQNFVIAIPRSTAEISQIYYEKTDENVKIHLTVNKGQLKKDNLSFYVTNAKPDLTITLGVKNFQKELLGKLDAFGSLLDAPIVNIDTTLSLGENTRFGKVNIIERASISESVNQIITALGPHAITPNIANALLTGLIIRYENFKNSATTPEVFTLAGELIKRGAAHHTIMENVFMASEREMQFLGHILQAIKASESYSVATLSSPDFADFSEREAMLTIEKIKTIGISNDILVLWQSHNSEPAVKGFFYSRKPALINKFAEKPYGTIKNGWVFLNVSGDNISQVKESILQLL